MHTLFCSHGAAERLARAEQWLRERGAAPTLVVAATRGAADDLVRRALGVGDGMFASERTTPRHLATLLALPSLASDGLVPVSTLGVEALAARSIVLCVEREALEYLGPVARFPGFPRALATTLTELRAEGVAAEALAGSGPAGNDLCELLRTYEAELARRGLADDAEILVRATERLRDDDSALDARSVLLLDVAPVSRREIEFFATLVATADEAAATLQRDDVEAERGIRTALDTATEATLDHDSGGGRLQRLRRDIFAAPAEEAPATDDRNANAEDDSLVFVSAPGEGRECVEIARRALRYAGAGVPFDRMAIFLRNPDGYLSLLEEAFKRAGVPAHFTRGTVRPDPSGRAFLALLACAAEDLSASRFAEYVSLGQVPAIEPAPPTRMVEVPWVEPEGGQLVFKTLVPEPAEPAAAGDHAANGLAPGEAPPTVAGTLRVPRQWERLLIDAAVVGGADRWKTRLAGLRAELELRRRHLDDHEEGRREALERRLRGLERLETFALPVIERLAALPPEATWGEWLAGLRQLASTTLRRPDRVLGVLAELEPMADVDEVSLDEVRRVLQKRLSFLRVEPEGHRYGKVLVATVEEARGRAFDTVFLPGLAEGIFPRRQSEDPLLLDRARGELERSTSGQAHLISVEERNRRERTLLRIAAGAAARRLVVSYPTLDGIQGRSRVPSFYALDIMRAAEGELPDVHELERRAAAGSASLLGWPAPRDPASAIDAAEFDVSYLAPLMRRPHEHTGKANFLLADNEHLARALRTRYRRWEKSGFTRSDGLVVGSEFEPLREHGLRQRSFSPTALQRFAACPYQFFLYAVHRLRPREEPAPLEQIDPLTRGSIFHEAQYELLTRLRAAGELPITTANRAAAARRADEVLAVVAERYEEQLAPAIPRVWRDEIQSIGIDLRGWVRRVAEQDDEWLPTYFEFSFGLGRAAGRDPESHRDEVTVGDGFRLRGAIDLIEKHVERDAWRVTDHKTGRPLRESRVVVGGGRVLQPLLYAMAAEAHLEGAVESGRLFYCTRKGDYETREVALDVDGRNKAEQVLGVISTAVDGGFLPAAPVKGACRFCDYRAVCGPYEETRIRRKDQGPLSTLQILRRAP